MLTRRSSDASVVSTVQGEGKSIASNPAKLLLSIEKLTSLIEENDFKYRENNVILMDLFDKQLKEAEEKIYAKIEQMKVDTIEKIGMAREFELDNSVYKKSNVPAIKESMKEHEDNDLNELTAKKDTELVTITPKPGFVIKTHRIEDYDKAFINVFHHAAVGIKPPKSDPHQSNANPYIVIGGVGNILDKDGHNCILYSVVVSSYYFDPSTRTRQELTGITENATITRIIKLINEEYKDDLEDSSFTLPRLANFFKGHFIPFFTVAIDHTPSTAHSTSHSRTGAINSESLDSDAIRAGITAKRSNSNSSILSNNTVVTQNGTTKKVSKRKSVLGDGLAYNEHNIAGRKKLTADMLEYIKDESVDSKTANAVKEESTTNPSVLLGWQIKATDDEGESIIFVVTDVRKNFLSKTEYRLSRYGMDDWWVKLKRGEHKNGLEFRPMRKVLYHLED